MSLVLETQRKERTMRAMMNGMMSGGMMWGMGSSDC